MIFLIAFLISLFWTIGNEIALHFFPWRKVFGKQLPRVMAYMLGVLGFLVPATGCLSVFGMLADETMMRVSAWMIAAVSALWIHVIAAGVTVIGCYALDHYLHSDERIQELGEELSLRRNGAQG